VEGSRDGGAKQVDEELPAGVFREQLVGVVAQLEPGELLIRQGREVGHVEAVVGEDQVIVQLDPLLVVDDVTEALQASEPLAGGPGGHAQPVGECVLIVIATWGVVGQGD
jgi:hypothetical protein